MEWWLWVVSGFVLLIAELFLSSGFFLFIFGLSALALGLFLFALSLGSYEITSSNQYITYAVLTIVMLFTVRRQIVNRLFTGSKEVSDEFTGKEVSVGTEIAPNAHGSAELRGTVWKVVNIGSAPIRAGESATVSRVEGLTLFVSKVQ